MPIGLLLGGGAARSSSKEGDPGLAEGTRSPGTAAADEVAGVDGTEDATLSPRYFRREKEGDGIADEEADEEARPAAPPAAAPPTTAAAAASPLAEAAVAVALTFFAAILSFILRFSLAITSAWSGFLDAKGEEAVDEAVDDQGDAEEGGERRCMAVALGRSADLERLCASSMRLTGTPEGIVAV